MGSMRSKLKCVVEWLSENVLCLTVFAEVKISFRERGWGKVSGGWLWCQTHQRGQGRSPKYRGRSWARKCSAGWAAKTWNL